MERAGLPEWNRRAIHALLNYPISRTGVHWAATRAQREAVPAHKRLENAPAGCGIAIGNHSSQFFANAYLDALDQFVKHVLKVPRYLRYVDDFVLVHHSREQLIEWQCRIADFLREHLRLELKNDQKLRPLGDGIDFLGYIVRPTHTIVRRRVVAHAMAKLCEWECKHVRTGSSTSELKPLEQLRSMWASYAGHFRHAATFKLRNRIFTRFQWLAAALDTEPKEGGDGE
jgi:hypothetical protein